MNVLLRFSPHHPPTHTHTQEVHSADALYCFEVFSANRRSYMLQAEGPDELRSWVTCIRRTIESQVGGLFPEISVATGGDNRALWVYCCGRWTDTRGRVKRWKTKIRGRQVTSPLSDKLACSYVVCTQNPCAPPHATTNGFLFSTPTVCCVSVISLVVDLTSHHASCHVSVLSFFAPVSDLAPTSHRPRTPARLPSLPFAPCTGWCLVRVGVLS